MHRPILLGGWLALASLAAAQPVPAAQIPDEILYQSRFTRIVNQKNDHLISDAARIYSRNQMGLSAKDYQMLDALAAEYAASLRAYFAAHEGQARDDQGYFTVTREYVKRLRQSLGEEKFQAPDKWTRREILPYILYSPPKEN